jgi:hypothetical protein
MRFHFLIIIVIIAFFSACKPTVESPKNSAVNTGNTNLPIKSAGNSNSPLGTTKTPEAPKVNDSESIKPVVLAHFEALSKKDDAGLRKVYSAETLKSFEADMKADKITTLHAFIGDSEPNLKQPYEVRNEELKGDSAIAEIKGGSFGVWTKMKFVKEGGSWKMTNESPEFDEIKNSAPAK